MNIAELRRLSIVALPAIAAALVTAILVIVVAKTGSGGDDDSAQAQSGPFINDHWHAAYAIFVGGERQPNIPTFTGPEEIHTHGDGIIHMHPFIPAGEGEGASLASFFRYGGGELTDDTLRIPGQRETYRAGDSVPGGDAPAVIRILRADSGIHPLGSGFSVAVQACDALPDDQYKEVEPQYIPQDGDCIRIVWGPD